MPIYGSMSHDYQGRKIMKIGNRKYIMKLSELKDEHRQKFEQATAMIQANSVVYKSMVESGQSTQLIETTIGAMLWYLPGLKNVTFTGMVSEAVRAGAKICVEHRYPRKVSAKLLLENPPKSGQEFFDDFVEKYGSTNWVTPEENKKLVPFQKVGVFTTPEEAYKQAGIKLVRAA